MAFTDKGLETPKYVPLYLQDSFPIRITECGWTFPKINFKYAIVPCELPDGYSEGQLTSGLLRFKVWADMDLEVKSYVPECLPTTYGSTGTRTAVMTGYVVFKGTPAFQHAIQHEKFHRVRFRNNWYDKYLSEYVDSMNTGCVFYQYADAQAHAERVKRTWEIKWTMFAIDEGKNHPNWPVPDIYCMRPTSPPCQ